MKISLNGKIISPNTACISPVNEGFMYGLGLFETIKVKDGKMFFLEEHLNRLELGCKTLSIDFNIKKDVIEKYCNELINKNNLCDGGIRIAYSKDNNTYNILITTRQNTYNEETYNKGFNICFALTKRNPESLLVGIKSNNYAENIITLKKAKEEGFDESIFTNVYEKISEGTISNIFFIKNKKVYTPSANCGLLQGIIRGKVIDIIKELGLDFQEGEFEKDSLYNADEIFLTNSLVNIMPVSKFEDNCYDLNNYLITNKLIAELNKLY